MAGCMDALALTAALSREALRTTGHGKRSRSVRDDDAYEECEVEGG
jgi:hypothetical protein